jgi:hypothetical protein
MSRWQPLSESLNPDVRLFVKSAWHRYLDGSKFPPRQAVETLGILAGADAARRAPVGELRAGDRVVFALAGAYAWNISHHEFLMHPRPGFHFL